MRICIVGAGAVGGTLGGYLAAAGHAVSLVARGEHLAALRRNGLTLRAPEGARVLRLPASDDPAAFGPQDAVVIALKAYAIAPMLPRLAPLLGTDTPVVTAINGLPWWYFYRDRGKYEGSRVECLDPDESMAAALDARHIVGCVVHAAAEVVAPGVIEHTGGRNFVLGEIDGEMTPRLAGLGDALSGAGLEPRLSARIRDDIWTKLIGNLSFNPVAALTGARMNEICANEGLLDLIRSLMVEAMTVGEAYGVRFAIGVEERIGMARRLGAAKISMLQDLERGRPLELDAIVAAVVELARRQSIPTPAIDGVLALARERARHALAGRE